MMTRLSTKRWIYGAILLLAVVVAFSIPWKLNVLRGWVGEKVQTATGRTLTIDGDVWWRWGRNGSLSVEGLRFANPPWATRPDMLTAERLEVRIALWPLLRREVRLVEVRAVQPDLWLEVSAQGQRNWTIDTEQRDGGGGATVTLGNVQLDAGHLAYIDPGKQVDVKAQLQTITRDGVSKLQVGAQGQWRAMAFKGQLLGDALLRLGDNAQPYTFTLDATVGRTVLAAQGAVVAPSHPESADIKVQLHGPSLGEWYRIAGVGLPDTPPYKTAGTVRFDGVRWSYENFASTVGSSDLGGHLLFDPSATRPLISGELVSTSLDLADFGPSFGAAAKPSAGSAAAQRQAKGQSKPKPDPNAKVLPQQKFVPDKWASIDTDLTFVGKSVRNIGSFPLDALRFRLRLADRQLAIEDLALGAAGGSLAGTLRIDGRQQPMQASIDATARKLRLDALLPSLSMTRSALGAVNGRVQLVGHGSSYAELLGTADGEAQLAMGKGRMSNLLLELLDLDVYEGLKFLVVGDRDVQVRCALVDAGFQRGQMQTRTAVLDTSDTIITANGKADFTHEKLDLRITPKSKDMSPLTARVPFDVTGSFADPSVLPDRTRLAARLGGAVVLGLINPLAAILPLIETGTGEDSDCAALMKVATTDGLPADASAAPAATRQSSDQNKK